MKRVLLIIALAGLVGCTAETTDTGTATPEKRAVEAPADDIVAVSAIPGVPDSAVRLGEEITVSEAPIPLASVRANPDAYFEKTILVSATTEAVCQTAGCWMTISDGEGEPIWVRWSTGCGGKYFFPKDAAGQRIVVQGSFYPKEIADADAEHIAEESGGALAADDIAGKTFEMNATACVVLPRDPAESEMPAQG